MADNLVIVESPAKARTIQKYLGEGFVVKSSFGHIRDLQDNRLSVDIDGGFAPQYVVSPDKLKVVSDLKKAAKQAGTVWLASDEDREGEAIAWHLATVLDLDLATTRRIVFHEITKTAIENGLKNPRTIDMNLVNAQQARRVLDRLVGFELSPLLWRKIQRGLSAGRVQSVALRLVVEREKEINAFRSEPYYRVEADFTISGKKVRGVLERKFDDMDSARQFLADSIDASYRVASVESRENIRRSAPPFTTSTLQQEASRKLHMPVSVTMRVAQALYERGLITYMRTDSTNLSSLAVNTAKKFICEQMGEEYSNPHQYRTHTKGAQEAHEAIRPTFIDNTSIEGTAQEKSLYSLIWKRMVASQMADARVMNTLIKVSSDKRPELYAIQGTKILFDGFLKLYMEDSDDNGADDGDEVILPEVTAGEGAVASCVNALCKFTQPPLRYSEATLVKKLEELGIGRPSTYATIISTLTKARGYIQKGNKDGRKKQVTNLSLKGGVISESSRTETVGAEKGKLLPQDIGIMVSDYLSSNFKDIMDYDFTAKVEKDFDDIARGESPWNATISQFYGPFHAEVQSALGEKAPEHTLRVIGTDPSDGRQIIAKLGQYGAYVQKGEGEDRQYANLSNGQLIETLTLEDALKLFQLPRTVGEYEGLPVIATKGRFGPYLKYDGRNFSLGRGKDPLSVSLEECAGIISQQSLKAPANAPVKEFPGSGITVCNGRYGPYLKKDGRNYRLPKGCDAALLDEKQCVDIIEGSEPTTSRKRFTRQYKKQ